MKKLVGAITGVAMLATLKWGNPVSTPEGSILRVSPDTTMVSIEYPYHRSVIVDPATREKDVVWAANVVAAVIDRCLDDYLVKELRASVKRMVREAVKNADLGMGGGKSEGNHLRGNDEKDNI